MGFALADSNAHQLATFEYVGPWRRLAPAEMPRGVPTTHSLDYINFRNREVKHSPSLAASSLKSYFCRPSHPLTANPAAIYGGKQSNSTPSFRISRVDHLICGFLASRNKRPHSATRGASHRRRRFRRRRHPRSRDERAKIHTRQTGSISFIHHKRATRGGGAAKAERGYSLKRDFHIWRPHNF